MNNPFDSNFLEIDIAYDLSYCFVKINEYMDKIQYSKTPDERVSGIIGMYQFILNPKAKDLLEDERSKKAFIHKAHYFLSNPIKESREHLRELLEKTLTKFLGKTT
jgi:hypothetical protein